MVAFTDAHRAHVPSLKGDDICEDADAWRLINGLCVCGATWPPRQSRVSN
jgi:hypothetical protein